MFSLQSRFILLMVVLHLAFLTFGCSKDKTTNSTTEPTEEEKQLIVQDIERVDSIVCPALFSSDPVAAFQQSLASVRALPWVEGATSFEATLTVKFKKGGIVRWDATPDVGGESTIAPLSKAPTPRTGLYAAEEPDLVGNHKVLFVNAVSMEGKFPRTSAMLSEIGQDLVSNGFDEPRVANAPECDISFFERKLGGYGVMVIAAHGSYNGKTTCIKPHGPDFTKEEIPNILTSAWKEWVLGIEVVGSSNPCELKPGRIVRFRFAVSEVFIRTNYMNANVRIPHSLIFLSSCGIFRDPKGAFAEALREAGAAAVVGWDANVTDPVASVAVKQIVSNMLEGDDLKTAYLNLPVSVRSNVPNTICEGLPAEKTWTANLKWAGDGSIRLVNPDYFIQGTVNGESWRMEEDVVCQSLGGLVEKEDGTQEMDVWIMGDATVDEGGEKKVTASFSLVGNAKGSGGLLVGESGVAMLLLPSLGPRNCDDIEFSIQVTANRVSGTFSLVVLPNVIGETERYPVAGSFAVPLKRGIARDGVNAMTQVSRRE